MRAAGTETLDMEWVVIAFDERDNALTRASPDADRVRAMKLPLGRDQVPGDDSRRPY
jgi:hypothetical protein